MFRIHEKYETVQQTIHELLQEKRLEKEEEDKYNGEKKFNVATGEQLKSTSKKKKFRIFFSKIINSSPIYSNSS